MPQPTAEEFISALVAELHHGTCEDVATSIAKPAGRQPVKSDLQLAAWFGNLSPEDRDLVQQLIKRSVHATLFNLLCVLDGAQAMLEPGTELVLLASNDFGTTRLNDPQQSLDLHSAYQASVYQHVFRSGTGSSK